MLEIAVLIALIALSGFFSGAEIALFSLSDIKVRKLIRKRKRGAKTLKKLKGNPHRMLVTILICNNVVNIASAAIATVLATNMFGSIGLGIATGIITFLILVFGEIVPKSFFHHNAERMSLIIAEPIYILTYVLYPVIVFVELISKGILRLAGVKNPKDEITEDEIMAALSLGAEAGVIGRDEEAMIQNIIDFGDSTVKDIMTPAKRMVRIRSDRPISYVIAKMLQTKYSRMPVYDKKRRNIIGIVNLRNTLNYIKSKNFEVPIEKAMDPVTFVGEDEMLDDVFDKMKMYSCHMAVVRDGQKRVKGLLTMEDLLEEIVGEIYDEPDRKRVRMHFVDKKTALVDGGTLIKELQEIGVPLKGKFATISDLLSARFDGNPKKGRGIKLKNFTLTVMDVEKKNPERITRIKIVKRRGKIKGRRD